MATHVDFFRCTSLTVCYRGNEEAQVTRIVATDEDGSLLEMTFFVKENQPAVKIEEIA